MWRSRRGERKWRVGERGKKRKEWCFDLPVESGKIETVAKVVVRWTIPLSGRNQVTWAAQLSSLAN